MRAIHILVFLSTVASSSYFLLKNNVLLVQGNEIDSSYFSPSSLSSLECQFEIRNKSNKSFSVHWIDPSTNDQIYISTILASNDSFFATSSYVGHTFLLSELPNETTGKCGDNYNKDEPCKSTTVTVTEADNEVVYLTSNFKITTDGFLANQNDYFFDDRVPDDLVGHCKEWAKNKKKCEQLQNNIGNDPEAPTQQQQQQQQQDYTILLSQVSECIQTGLASKFFNLNQDYHFERDVRVLVSNKMENYTCLNPDFETTPDIDLQYWTNERNYGDNNNNNIMTREVHIKLDRPTSRIHVISNFVSTEECDAMEAVAKPILHDATVADGKGGSKKSLKRKAKQAGINPKFSKEADGDLVARLSRRVYDYTNHVLGLNITEHGQEPLMSIQYFGRGYNDTEPDQYAPHCDGQCDGTPHFFGSRVATMVMYCTIPERGGHTNFQNAGVHIKPEVGNAIFFSYIDPTTNLTDDGLTEHSGCPVYEGEKKIITQWVRYGVNGKERRHFKFNTLGILHAESGEN